MQTKPPKVAVARILTIALIVHGLVAAAAIFVDPGFWYVLLGVAVFAVVGLSSVLSTEVDEDGISQIRPNGRVRMAWREIESVKFEGRGIHLRSKRKFIVVSTEIFQNSSEAESFLQAKLRTDLREDP